MNINRLPGMVMAMLSCSWAIPLRTGDVWEWQVMDRVGRVPEYRVAKILDSTKVDAGTVWQVGVTSSGGSVDAGRIFVSKNGRQHWLKKTQLLPVELCPYDSVGDSFVVVDGDTTEEWGEVACGTGDLVGHPIQGGNVDCEKFGWRYDPVVRGPAPVRDTWRVRTPQISWVDSTGFQFFTVYGDNGVIFDWRLIRRNGAELNGVSPMRFSGLPHIGDSIRWAVRSGEIQGYSKEYLNTTKIEELHNAFEAVLALTYSNIIVGTGGWVSVVVRETLAGHVVRQVKKFKTITQVGPTYAWDSSLSDTSQVTISTKITPIRLRINTNTGVCSTLTDRTIAGFFPESGWWSYWDDSLVGEYRYPRLNKYSAGIRVSQGQVDSSWYVFGTESPQSVPVGSAKSYTTSTISTRRIAWGVGVTPRSHGMDRTSLRQLVERYPETSVTWRNAQGRQGIVEARRLDDPPVSLRGKILFLDAVFPDGTRWRGAQFVPR